MNALPKVNLRGRWLEQESMANHVSWRAGGLARRALFPSDIADLQQALEQLAHAFPAEPILFVGLGSNLLVRDGGFAGTVIFTHPNFQTMRFDESGEAYVECGVAGAKLARRARREGFGGVLFLAGVPGTVGGALAMNAGCFGAEIWPLVRSVRTIDRRGEVHQRSPQEFIVAYRSIGPTTAREEWFLAATLQLPRLNETDQSIESMLKERAAKQPLQWPNAGSVFKNPPGDHAARLIEAAGLKGRRIGGAEVSAKHANFIINAEGHATASDIENLIALVQAQVADHSGIHLEREVRIVGERS